MTVLRPVEAEGSSGNMRSPSAENAPYVNRRGAVSFSVGEFLQRSKPSGKRRAAIESFRGRLLELSFFSGKAFSLRVDADTRPRQGVLMLNGHREGQRLKTFTLTIAPRSFFIHFQNLDTGTLYRVVGQTDTGQGQVTEIDLTQVPPMVHPRIAVPH